MAKPVYLDKEMKKRFWLFVDKRGENECWLWTGPKNGDGLYSGGYGMFSLGGGRKRSELAHRVSYEIAHGHKGIIAHPTWYVGHVCRNFNPTLLMDDRLCVNPKHLVLTSSENDSKRKRFRRKELGLTVPPRKISSEVVLAVMHMFFIDGLYLVDISKSVGVITPTLWKWITGRNRINLLEDFSKTHDISMDQLQEIARKTRKKPRKKTK